MSAGTYIDAQGKEHTLPIAVKTITVKDEKIGINRMIVAGQHVPGDLINEYNAAIGKDAEDESADESADEKSDATGEPKISSLTKDELKAYATEHGIELGDAKTNAEIIAVIEAAQAPAS